MKIRLRRMLVILLFFASLPATSQVDSLLLELNKALPDTQRVWVYRDLSYYLVSNYPDSAEVFAKKGYELAKDIGFNQGEERTLRMVGLVYEYQNLLDSALNTYQKCYQLALRNKEAKAVGDILNVIGIACFYQGEKSLALEYYDQAEHFCDSIQYHEGQAVALNNMGVIFRTEGNFDLAAETYRTSIRIKEALKDSAGLAASFMNLGICLGQIQEYTEAEEALQRSIFIYRELGMDNEIVILQISRGKLLADKGEDQLALKVFDTYFEAANSYDLIRSYTSYSTYGELLLESGRIPQAERILTTGYGLIKGTERSQELKSFERLLYELYDRKGDSGKALFHLKNSIALRDSFEREDDRRIIEEFEAKYDTKIKESQIQMQDLELQRKNQEQIMLGGGIVFAVLLLIIAIVAGLNVRKKNAILSEQKKIIEETLADREVLLREIHHRVKNNLQVISSLLSLQSRSIEDDSALEAVNESRNRVHSMALIHENLYNREDLRNIRISTYVAQLSEDILSSYNIEPEKIKLNTSIENVKLDVDEVIPLGLIINELITNALKYAFPKDQKGSISIHLKEEEQMIELKVTDNGVGIPEEVVNAGGRPKSLGMRLIKTFAKKLKAEWSITNDKGTHVVFRFQSLHKRKGDAA